MTYLLVSVTVLVSAASAAIGLARHRPARVVSLQPKPETYRSIRVLHNDDEIRDAARRAYERERWIAHQADRRGARFRQLTASNPTGRRPMWSQRAHCAIANLVRAIPDGLDTEPLETSTRSRGVACRSVCHRRTWA